MEADITSMRFKRLLSSLTRDRPKRDRKIGLQICERFTDIFSKTITFISEYISNIRMGKQFNVCDVV